MQRDKAQVAMELRMRVLGNYHPSRTAESCEDHCCDWFVLSEEEFDAIERVAHSFPGEAQRAEAA